MTQSILFANAMNILHTTNLNIYLFDNENNVPFFHEIVKMPSFMRATNEKELGYFSEQMIQGEKIVYSYVTKEGLYYLGFPFNYSKPYTIIAGPYLSITPNLHALIRKYQLSNDKSEMVKDYFNNLQLLSTDKVNGFVSVLHQFEHMLHTNPERASISTLYIEDSPKKETDFYLEEDDREIIELRYKVENRIMNAVATGNKQEAANTYIANNSLFTFSDRFPNQPIARVKNLMTIFNTLLRKAAKEGNVPTYLIHRMSEKYAYKIMYTNRLDRLQKLSTEMIEDYSDLVLSQSIQSCSKSTKIVIEYLVSNYDKPMDKEYLASITFTHPGHLSRKFKQDTGKTLVSYQQTLRIERAKYLLDTENLPIEEIAWIVGYDDASYFSRVFKKEVGCTPTEYRLL